MSHTEKNVWTCDFCNGVTEEQFDKFRPPGWRVFYLKEETSTTFIARGVYDCCAKCCKPYESMVPIRRLLGWLGVFRR